MDPQQELFIRLKKDIEALGYDVYDGFLPPENTPYPFVYIGEMLQLDDANKTAVFGRIEATIHIYNDDPNKRGTVSDMLLKIKTVCRNIRNTRCFNWDVRNVTQRIIPDNTTCTPLMHGVLDIEFKFS